MHNHPTKRLSTFSILVGIGRILQGKAPVYKNLELGVSDIVEHTIHRGRDVWVPELCAHKDAKKRVIGL